MRLSLLRHSASATIAPAGSLWTNDSRAGANRAGGRGGCCFRTDGLEGDTKQGGGRAVGYVSLAYFPLTERT